MQNLYTRSFRQPWDYRERSSLPAIPRFNYVTPDPRLEHGLFFSRTPTTPEFELIHWKEGRGYSSNRQNAWPILVAHFDIDNDGIEDLVIKYGFMLAVCGGGGSCPGGEDHIAVLRPGTMNLDEPLDQSQIIQQYLGRSPKGYSISYDTLRYQKGEAPKGAQDGERMGARSIRPFIYENRTYLSVYEQWAVDYPAQRREWMWVLEYRGGGSNPLTRDHEWIPAKTATMCRFRMIPAPGKP